MLTLLAVVGAGFGIAPLAFAQAGASFQGLGDLPGGSFFSQAYGLSADGSTVVGYSKSMLSGSGLEAFRWTESGGMVDLGSLPGGSFSSWADAVSANGSVVVGGSVTASGPEAFLWTESGGMVGLGSLLDQSSAHDVSANGMMVVGTINSVSASFEAFRWTDSGGMVGLGDLPGGSSGSGADGASADGSTVVGWSYSGSGTEAFRWTQVGGMTGLGDLPGGSFRSNAFAVSADGSTVVGLGFSASGEEAFRWTQLDGMVGLGFLPSDIASLAYGVSSDGSTVVGSSRPTGAFIWDATNGMRSIRDILVNDFGLDLTDWTLLSAQDISDDGPITIVGYGLNPSGNTEAWIATIPGGGCPTLLGDVNGDSLVDGTDIAGYVRVKLGVAEPADNEACADYGTGSLDDDTALFVADLLNKSLGRSRRVFWPMC